MQKKAAARAPGSFEQYLADIRERTTALERFTDRATSLDERIDVSNLLLIEILKSLAKEIEIHLPEYPKEGAPETTGYAIKSYPMDTARASPGEEIKVQGDTIIAYTDDLAGCFIRVNSPVGDPIPLEAFNPYTHPGSFNSLWLETPAQPGRTITLLIGRAGAQAMAQTVRTIITAALATVNVDVVAQTVGNIGIDIAAQTVGDIDINIAGQVGDINIDVTAQSVGIFLQAEWAAVQGDDVSIYAIADDRARNGGAIGMYVVPAGRTLYITQFGGACYAEAAADGDLNQMCEGLIYNAVAVYYSAVGGNGGFATNYSKPLVVTAGQTIYFVNRNRSNHNCRLSVMGSGYLI